MWQRIIMWERTYRVDIIVLSIILIPVMFFLMFVAQIYYGEQVRRLDEGFGETYENRVLIWKTIEVVRRLHPKKAPKIFNELNRR